MICNIFLYIFLLGVFNLSVIIGHQPPYLGRKSISKRFVFTFPGTKWCGPGNIAANYNDLGINREEDKCCRAHDNCADQINSHNTKSGLTNDSPYTRLSCDCDFEFRKCLNGVNGTNQSTVGTLYFDVITQKCFRKEHPVTGCREWGGFLNQKCYKHNYDEKLPKIYQWFDVPKYAMN